MNEAEKKARDEFNAEFINSIFTSSDEEAREVQKNILKETFDIDCSKILDTTLVKTCAEYSDFKVTAYDKENKIFSFYVQIVFPIYDVNINRSKNLMFKIKDKTNNVEYEPISLASILISDEPKKREIQLELFQKMTGLKLNKIIDVEDNSICNTTYLLEVHAKDSNDEDISFTLEIVLPEEFARLVVDQR